MRFSATLFRRFARARSIESKIAVLELIQITRATTAISLQKFVPRRCFNMPNAVISVPHIASVIKKKISFIARKANFNCQILKFFCCQFNHSILFALIRRKK
jgi:hypothetical protein